MFNPRVATRLGSLFGSAIDSNCTILFCRSTSEPDEDCSQQPAKRARLTEGASPSDNFLGDPLLAHTFVLRHASERFEARISERWKTERAESSQQPAEATGTEPSGSSAGAIVLRIPLSSEAEVPAARAAIKFAYTGRVEAANVREALEVRWQAGYLQIEGCTAACDECIKRLIQPASEGMPEATRPGEAQASSADPASQEHLQSTAALFELYACQDLWRAAEEDESFKQLLAAAKRQLVAHFKDAFTTLNTSSLRQQLLGLPAEGLEALLEADDYGTDCESTVLLLLATWMEVNYTRTDAATRGRLCRLVRLVQLSRAYLTLVLPALALDHETQPEQKVGWFSVDPMEAAFVAQYASASEAERKRMANCTVWDLKSPTYSSTRRAQAIPQDGLSFTWSIEQSEVTGVLENLDPDDARNVYGSFQDQEVTGVAANGCLWRPFLQFVGWEAAAGLYVRCELPAAFKLPGSRLCTHSTSGVPASITARVAVNRTGSKPPMERVYSAGTIWEVGRGRGKTKFLPLQQEKESGAVGKGGGGDSGGRVCTDCTAGAVHITDSTVAALSDYLIDGKITGKLLLLRP